MKGNNLENMITDINLPTDVVLISLTMILIGKLWPVEQASGS